MLFDVLPLEVSFFELAERCFAFVERTLLRLEGPFSGRLRRIKNAAYAWGQMSYSLSPLKAQEVHTFLELAEARVAAASSSLRARLDPIVVGLAAIAGHERFDHEERVGQGPFFNMVPGPPLAR